MSKAQKIYNLLLKDGIIDSIGTVKMHLLNVEFELTEKSAIGDLLQEWLKNWMESKRIYFRLNPNTQEPPDFFLSDDNTKDLLEVKVFTGSANFDVANFDTYLRYLLTDAYKIDSDYLIFEYDLSGGVLKIKNIWLKKIWEITCPSERYPIRNQCKQDKIINIRPANWYSERVRFTPFNSKKDFILALNETIQNYEHLSRAINKDTWLEAVKQSYHSTTGKDLF